MWAQTTSHHIMGYISVTGMEDLHSVTCIIQSTKSLISAENCVAIAQLTKASYSTGTFEKGSQIVCAYMPYYSRPTVTYVKQYIATIV